MHALRSVLEQAQQTRVAVGHFNVADLVLLKAVFVSAQELKVPVLVGVSEGEREFMGVPQIAALVRSLREEFDFPIFLNADHTHSLVKAVEAAKAGFDAVVFDLSALPFEQNVRQTKAAVEALKAINPSILVEGEIGDIGTGFEIHTETPDLSKSLTTPEEARQFVESTGVDILAPAVGNRHGMLKSMVQGEARKHLDIQRIGQIKKAARTAADMSGRAIVLKVDTERYPELASRFNVRGRNQYCPHQYGAAGCLETRLGKRLGKTTRRSCSIQDSSDGG